MVYESNLPDINGLIRDSQHLKSRGYNLDLYLINSETPVTDEQLPEIERTLAGLRDTVGNSYYMFNAFHVLIEYSGENKTASESKQAILKQELEKAHDGLKIRLENASVHLKNHLSD